MGKVISELSNKKIKLNIIAATHLNKQEKLNVK